MGYTLCHALFRGPAEWMALGTPIRHSVVLGSYFMTWLLLATLTNFFKFHLKLIWENYTTIENIEREDGQRSKFDIGPRRNLEQVLGANTLLWLLPLHIPLSRPVGDGVRWRVHYTRVIDEDEELPADTSRGITTSTACSRSRVGSLPGGRGGVRSGKAPHPGRQDTRPHTMAGLAPA